VPCSPSSCRTCNRFASGRGTRKSCAKPGASPRLLLARFVKRYPGMKLPKIILVPVDFSEGSTAALDYAVGLAGKLDAKIVLLNVVGVQVLGAEYGMPVSASAIELIYETNQQELAKLVDANKDKASFARTLLETGDPRAMIEGTAKKLGADLIVMGTHGRRGLRRLLIGSVAESVVRSAPCPVLLVRAEEVS
jgi:universal stress protein A